MKDKNTSVFSMFVMLIIIVYFIDKCNSCGNNDSSNTTKTDSTPIKTKAIQLTFADSIRIKGEIAAIIKSIDQRNILPTKARKQFVYFLGEIQNYRATDYNGYEAAKVAKNAFDNAFYSASNVLPPDDLPEDLKKTFSDGIEDISQYYFEGSKAFKAAMETFNGNGDMNTIDEFKENMTSADAEWKRGVFEIAEVNLYLSPLSEYKKHKLKQKDNTIKSSSQPDSLQIPRTR